MVYRRYRITALLLSILSYISFSYVPFSTFTPMFFSNVKVIGYDALNDAWRAFCTFELFELRYYLASAAFWANPLLWSAWVATWENCRCWTCTATVLAVLCFSPVILISWSTIAPCPGYWLWICSNGIILLATFFEWKPPPSQEIEPTTADEVADDS
jgi:hypothetical protein